MTKLYKEECVFCGDPVRVQVRLGQYGFRSDQMAGLMFALRVSHRVTSGWTHAHSLLWFLFSVVVTSI